MGEARYGEDAGGVDDRAGVANHIKVGDLVEYVSATSGWVHIHDGGELSDQEIHHARTPEFDIDNGAGTTIDAVIAALSFAITIRAARIVYTTVTAGTVAAGNARIGTGIGGAQIVASTAYVNSSVIGAVTAMTLVTGVIAADRAIHVRHTGVAATVAGIAFVEIEYTKD